MADDTKPNDPNAPASSTTPQTIAADLAGKASIDAGDELPASPPVEEGYRFLVTMEGGKQIETNNPRYARTLVDRGGKVKDRNKR